MASNDAIRTPLDAFKTGTIQLEIKMNAKVFHLRDEIKVYSAEIEGVRPEGMTEDELYSTATLKVDVPCGRLKQTRHGVVQSVLVSPMPIPRTPFKKDGTEFTIVPHSGEIALSKQDAAHRDALVKIAYSEIRKQFSDLSFIQERGSGGSAPRAALIKNEVASKVYQAKHFYYHVFEGINFRVYWYEQDCIVVILDTHCPVIKSSLSAGKLSKVCSITYDLVSVEYMPKLVRLDSLRLRKCVASERYRREFNILDKIELQSLSIDPHGKRLVIPIPGSKAKYLPNPSFFFGAREYTIDNDTPFNVFNLNNLLAHGPYNRQPLPKIIKLKLVRMVQVEDRYVDKMVEGLQSFFDQFKQMYRMELVAVGPGETLRDNILILPSTEAGVEHYCEGTLRDQYKAGEFDIVIGLLQGDDYNHPYRRAIKKGLQSVPSQILKHHLFNSPKMFADMYKTSIAAQIIYKSKGIIAAPITPRYLKDFKVRIYYDVGHKRLPGAGEGDRRRFSIVGIVAMVTDDKVYHYNLDAVVNDYESIETTTGDIVRQLIRKAVTSYVKDRQIKAIDGPLLLQRDGIFGKDEPGPALDEINALRAEGLIPTGTSWAFIEFIKDSPARLFSHEITMEPRRGTLFLFSQDRAFLTTTGVPDIHASDENDDEDEGGVGVAKTLEIRLVASADAQPGLIEMIAKDVYYRSFLWNATFSKARFIVEANMVHELLDLCRQGVTELPKYMC